MPDPGLVEGCLVDLLVLPLLPEAMEVSEPLAASLEIAIGDRRRARSMFRRGDLDRRPRSLFTQSIAPPLVLWFAQEICEV